MAKKQVTNSKQTSLFDIRLKHLDHDVLVLKGNEHDAASAFLSGNIVLSVNEPLTIRKLSLRLYATLRLNWTDHFQTPKGTFPKPVRFEKRIYEYQWENTEISQYLSNLYENSSHARSSIGLSKTHSTTSLKSLGHTIRSKSSSNLSGLHFSPLSSSSNLMSLNNSSTNLASNKSNHVLVQGNYEIPFSTILPGSMPESVEGLPGASVVYKLEAVIDRGKFHNSMITKKHLRVVRTLTTDSVELSETVAVDNTWPQKVEYSLNVPSKAIAIGSGTPISFMLVPLLKGLRLGDIKIQLVEYYSYVGYVPPAHNGERVVAEKFIQRPDENDPNFQLDKWEVDTFLQVPVSLSKCTQDCDIQTHMKVRHKLKFVIGLVNPDGHVSELRASLPVQLFISPFVTISVKHDNLSDSSSFNGEVGSADNNYEEEEVLFASDIHNASQTSLNQLNTPNNPTISSNSNSANSFNGLMAPPLYEKHIYDRLWSDVSPIESPINSGTATPRNYARTNNDIQQQFSMSPIDSHQLNENLRQLSLQRQSQESSEQLVIPSSHSGLLNVRDRQRDTAIFNLDGENMTNPAAPGFEVPQGDYFTRGRPALSSSLTNQYFLSSGVQSPPTHLSRTNSDNSLPNSTDLSKVPSYSQAIRSEVQDELLSPAYVLPLPQSNINLAELNRRFEEMTANNNASNASQTKNRSILSRGSSSLNLRNLSRSSSSNSSPSQSRNVSSNNLSILSVNLSRSSSKRSVNNSSNNALSFSPPSANIITNSTGSAIFTMTPASTSPVSSNNIKTQDLPSNLLHQHINSSASIVKPSIGASDRTAVTGPKKSSSSSSLHNLQFLNKKKDKK